MPIRNLLDIDYYKFTMGQIAFHHDVPVKYEFKNRSKERLVDYINESDLRYALDRIQDMSFTYSDLEYLKRLGFQDDYVSFLQDLRLPDYKLEIGDDIHISVEGMWSEAIYWETLILSTVNELINSGRDSEAAWDEGALRLYYKIHALKKFPELKFADFGTRRRFSRAWQDRVLWIIKGHIPHQLLGTSNVDMAREFGMTPIGTFAHEMYMVMYGVHGDIDVATKETLNLWESFYGPTIALSDTYGTDYFLENLSLEEALRWDGLRQDSGDPFEVGHTIVDWYRSKGINSSSKKLVFSDGLDTDTILALWNEFNPLIQTSFGWGTNLMNDLGFEPWSLVMKVTEVDGKPTFKLSDNPNKASGPKELIEKIKRQISYGKKPQEIRY